MKGKRINRYIKFLRSSATNNVDREFEKLDDDEDYRLCTNMSKMMEKELLGYKSEEEPESESESESEGIPASRLRYPLRSLGNINLDEIRIVVGGDDFDEDNDNVHENNNENNDDVHENNIDHPENGTDGNDTGRIDGENNNTNDHQENSNDGNGTADNDTVNKKKKRIGHKYSIVNLVLKYAENYKIQFHKLKTRQKISTSQDILCKILARCADKKLLKEKG